jgi:hypothetical protein
MTGWEIAIIGEFVLVVAIGTVTLVLARHVGFLSMEVRTAASGEEGPKLATPAPRIAGRALRTRKAVSSDPEPDRPTLVAFLTPTCSSCSGMIGPLNEIADKGVRVLAVLAGPAPDCEEFAGRLTPPALADADVQGFRRFGMRAAPNFVLVNEAGVVTRKGPAHDRETLRRLIAPVADSDPVDDVLLLSG